MDQAFLEGDFWHPSRPPWVPLSFLYNGCKVSFPLVKGLGCGVDDTPPPSSTEVNERAILHFWASWPVLR